MPYIERDASNNIKGVYQVPQPGYAEEFLPDSDPAVIIYLTPPPPPDAVARLDQAELKIAFNHENRIRALESKAPITMQQFQTAVRTIIS